ncbi:MAG TPA: ABC transporter ATP-binding protein [Candidatus Saccharibacteria bacterium]|nr:ABC transporter ATP-binding protein [Candidatus Saccharibacteria bacterium]
MLEVTNLKKIFRSGDTQIAAVDDVSFKINSGEFASIIGQSGSGKTTILGILGALEKPSSGNIKIDKADITKLSDHALIKYRAKKIGFVFQGYNLVPNLSALENVMMPMLFAHTSKKESHARAVELLNRVGLTNDKQKRKPGRLSGGEQQRVAIARALANKPKLILADEPTGNLDSKTGRSIFQLLHNLSRDEETTVLVVTHDLEIARQADRVFRLENGKMSQIKGS